MFSDALKRRQKLLHIIGDSFDNDINDAIKLVTNTVKDGRFLFFAGNGGSAAEAQHMSAEYIATLDHRNYRKGIKALALTVDTSFITAWTNDFEYETIFSRQLETLGAPNDLLFAYSTSGNSKNIIKVIEYASKNRIKIVGLDFDRANYIFTNFMSEVNKNTNKRYDIPKNFVLFDTFYVNGVKVYEVYKKNN